MIVWSRKLYMHNFICTQTLCINFRAVHAKLGEISGQNCVHGQTDGQPWRFQYTLIHFVVGGGYKKILKIMWAKEKVLCNQHFILCAQCFLPYHSKKSIFLCTIILFVCKCFQFSTTQREKK